MSTRSIKRSSSATLAAAIAVAASACSAFAADLAVKAPAAAPAQTSFFIVNDNSISFTWYPTATDPGVPGGGVAGNSNAFNKFVGTATHFDVWAYGTNFFNIDILKSDKNNPVGDKFLPGATGATEVYAFERSTLGLNQLTNSKMFSSLLFKNIEFEFGGDINTENDGVGPQKRDVVFGAQFDLNLPGTVNFSVLAYKEWNNNNYFIVPGAFSGETEYHWIPRLELLAIEPLTFLPWPVTWRNFTGVNFPKGSGVSQAQLNALCAGGCSGTNPFSAFSKTEVFEDNRIVLDASKLWFDKPGIWDLYAGYRYWYNKFGTDHNAPLFAQIAPGTAVESTAYIGTTYHFK
jgi:hypothetical protein